MSHVRAHRAQWIAMLAKLTSPMESTQAAIAFNAFLPMLTDYPDAAFTHDSLDYVATECHGVPTYADVRQHLGAWWKRNRPQPLAIADAVPELPPLRTDAEAAHARSLVAETVAHLKDREEERNAQLAKAIPSQPRKTGHLSPAELAEAYRRAGIKRGIADPPTHKDNPHAA